MDAKLTLKLDKNVIEKEIRDKTPGLPKKINIRDFFVIYDKKIVK